MGEEKDEFYYDRVILKSPKFKGHYTENSSWKCGAWPEAVKHISSEDYVLELGCGTGQFAQILREKANPAFYMGIDFSSVAIDLAMRRNLEKGSKAEYHFLIRDLNKESTMLVVDMIDYTTVVTFEFLEHVEKDLDILDRIELAALCGKEDGSKRTIKVVASVPAFDAPAHVRHFEKESQVRARYGGIIKNMELKKFIKRKKFKNHFIWLMVGEINP